MNKIRVLFFATLRDRAGMRQLDLELPDGLNVLGLKDELRIRIPNLSSSLDSVLVAVNREYAFDEDLLPTEAEIAFFPPVSGG
jgi:molybdopterin converting factor subunit 1